jgi:hypothetical protein
MASKSLQPMSDAELRRNMVLLGPPPVLSTENANDFEEIFLRFAESFKVQDMLMLDLVWHYAANSWFIRRCMRHGTVAIERWSSRNHRTEMAQAQYNKAQYEKQLQSKARQMSRSPADVAEIAALHEKIARTVADIDGILAHKDTEIEHNRALAITAEFQEQIDHLNNSATRRRNDAYDLLERYSTGLGRAVQETFDKIVDAEFEEIGKETKTESEPKTEDQPAIAAPSIAATGVENCNDIESQNSSQSVQ